MTSELGPSARALLDAARAGGPDAAAIARMRGKIDAAVAGAPAAAAPASASLTSTLAGKLGLLALAVIVATGAFVIATRGHREPVEQVVIASEPPPAAEPARSIHGAREPAPQGAPLVDEAEIEMPPTRREPVTPSVRRTPAIELAREVELVDRALAALRRGESRAALVAIRSYAVEAGTRGQLAEDAAAIEIEALCTLRDPSAVTRRAAFDARWPASSQRAKLARACP